VKNPRRARLAQRRRTLGLTQEALANLLCVDRSTVARWERGDTEPALWIRPRLARALRTPVDELPELLARGGPPGGMVPGKVVAGSSATPVPHLLPAPVAGFTGRSAELLTLNGVLDEAGGPGPGAVVISAVGGTPGAGKTALALHWANRAAGRFADGQLFADLRGFDPAGRPVTADEVIRGFLGVLGVTPDRIPSAPDARARLYQSLLTGRRMLIVLDNARDERQVRPLLPASPGSLVLVTSRDPLTGLAMEIGGPLRGAWLLRLDLLTEDEAVGLLTEHIGRDRAAAEPDSVAEIASLCGRLPLALAIGAARAARPGLPLAVVAEELRDAHRRLRADAARGPYADGSAAGDAPGFGSPGSQPGLGVPDGSAGLGNPGISGVCAGTGGSSDLGSPRVSGPRGVRQLPSGRGGTGLLSDRRRVPRLSSGRGVSRLSSGRDVAGSPDSPGAPDGPADLHTDIRAVLSWSYQQLDSAAARMFRLLAVHPGPDITAAAAASLAAVDAAEASRMLDELSRVRLITEHAPGRYALHELLRGYAVRETGRTDSKVVRRAAVGRLLDHYLYTAEIACSLITPSARTADSRLTPGTRPERLGDSRQALAWYEAERAVLVAVVTLADQAGFDVHGWRLPRAMMPFLASRGHHVEWAATQRMALSAATRLGDFSAQAACARYLAFACNALADHDKAARHFSDSIAACERLGDRRGEASAHHGLCLVAERQERYADAIDHAARAFRLYQETGNETGGIDMINAIGWFRALLGDFERSRASCEQALRLAVRAGYLAGQENAWDSLGYADYRLGNFGAAADCYERALSLCRQRGNRADEATFLTHLGDSRLALGQRALAGESWRQAVAILDNLGHPNAAKVRARLASARLGPAELGRAGLGSAELGGAELGGAELGGAEGGSAELGGAGRNSPRRDTARRHSGQLARGHFDSAQLDSAQLDSAQLDGAHLDGAQPEAIQADATQVDGAQFDGARLDGLRTAARG